MCMLFLVRWCRCFHASPELLAKRRNEEVFGLKAPKKEKRVRKENRTQPPVEAPYVPPKPKRTTTAQPDKTIDIFEGMTLSELAKRTGDAIPTLQDILINVGEKVDSEFDPISIDIAELVAMVCLIIFMPCSFLRNPVTVQLIIIMENFSIGCSKLRHTVH